MVAVVAERREEKSKAAEDAMIVVNDFHPNFSDFYIIFDHRRTLSIVVRPNKPQVEHLQIWTWNMATGEQCWKLEKTCRQHATVSVKRC